MPDPIADLHRYIDALRNETAANPRNTVVCLPASEIHDALIAMRTVEQQLAAARARLARVDTLLTREDGSYYEHRPGCFGEEDCPACWSNRILVALDPGGDIQAAQQGATE